MNSSKEILFVAGARPNFIKIAPLLQAMKAYPRLSPYFVHTGQHYDEKLCHWIFEDLKLPSPDVNLDVGSGSHGEQTAKVMERLEKILLMRKPHLVVVVGDVNSTLAGSLTAVKLHIPVAHVEAGLRSGDRAMPEEINRIVTDSVSDYLFTHSKEADKNLLQEGIPKEKIIFVGNVMIDTLKQMLPKALEFPPLTDEHYGLVTLHRPSNVDQPKILKGIFSALAKISKFLPLYFPVHPRTALRLKHFNILPQEKGFHMIEPLSYLPFLGAMAKAKLVLTDSGGIQEETTVLSIPCLTLRKNSERMVTVSNGTNKIVGENPKKIVLAAKVALKFKKIGHSCPELWDGKASERIVQFIASKI